MVSFFAMPGNSCLAVVSLIVFLRMFCLIKVRSFQLLYKKRCQKVATKLLFGRGRPAKQRLHRLCQPL